MRKHDMIRKQINKLEFEDDIYRLNVDFLRKKSDVEVVVSPLRDRQKLIGVTIQHLLKAGGSSYETILVGVKQLKRGYHYTNSKMEVIVK